MIKYELNIHTDEFGKLIIPKEFAEFIPTNSIVKLVIYSSNEKSIETAKENEDLV